MTPAHDEPLEEQAARAPTNSGYSRNGTLFPQVYRAAAPPFASKIHTPWVFAPSCAHTLVVFIPPSESSSGLARRLRLSIIRLSMPKGPSWSLSIEWGSSCTLPAAVYYLLLP